MQIKKINASEYQLVTGLFNNYRIFYKQQPDITLAENFIKERLSNNESIIFVAFSDYEGQSLPVGFTQLYPLISSVKAIKNWLLNDLYVNADYRKQGIGEALIKTAMVFAKEQNSNFIRLETAFDNYTAQKLYETIGFKKQKLNSADFVYQAEIAY